MVPIIDRLDNRRTFLKSLESNPIGLSVGRILMRFCRLSYFPLLVVFITFLCTSPSEGETERGIKPAAETDSSVDLGTYHALIIGINSYSAWPPLKFAEQDARDIRQILINRYGFAPERITDLFGEDPRESMVSLLISDDLGVASEGDVLNCSALSNSQSTLDSMKLFGIIVVSSIISPLFIPFFFFFFFSFFSGLNFTT